MLTYETINDKSMLCIVKQLYVNRVYITDWFTLSSTVETSGGRWSENENEGGDWLIYIPGGTLNRYNSCFVFVSFSVPFYVKTTLLVPKFPLKKLRVKNHFTVGDQSTGTCWCGEVPYGLKIISSNLNSIKSQNFVVVNRGCHWVSRFPPRTVWRYPRVSN